MEGGVLISSYEQRVTERTRIWVVVSFLCLLTMCACSGRWAQRLPGGLKANSGLQTGEAASKLGWVSLLCALIAPWSVLPYAVYPL